MIALSLLAVAQAFLVYSYIIMMKNWEINTLENAALWTFFEIMWAFAFVVALVAL